MRSALLIIFLPSLLLADRIVIVPGIYNESVHGGMIGNVACDPSGLNPLQDIFGNLKLTADYPVYAGNHTVSVVLTNLLGPKQQVSIDVLPGSSLNSFNSGVDPITKAPLSNSDNYPGQTSTSFTLTKNSFFIDPGATVVWSLDMACSYDRCLTADLMGFLPPSGGVRNPLFNDTKLICVELASLVNLRVTVSPDNGAISGRVQSLINRARGIIDTQRVGPGQLSILGGHAF